MLAEDEKKDGDGDGTEESSQELEGVDWIDPKSRAEEGREEPEDGHVGDVTLGFVGESGEVEVVREEDVLGDPELAEAVDVVGERAPLEGERACKKGGEEDRGDRQEKNAVRIRRRRRRSR